MDEADFKKLVDGPPAHLAPLAGQYRNALAVTLQARARLGKLSTEMGQVQRTLLEAGGAEQALKAALVACAALPPPATPGE